MKYKNLMLIIFVATLASPIYAQDKGPQFDMTFRKLALGELDWRVGFNKFKESKDLEFLGDLKPDWDKIVERATRIIDGQKRRNKATEKRKKELEKFPRYKKLDEKRIKLREEAMAALKGHIAEKAPGTTKEAREKRYEKYKARNKVFNKRRKGLFDRLTIAKNKTTKKNLKEELYELKIKRRKYSRGFWKREDVIHAKRNELRFQFMTTNEKFKKLSFLESELKLVREKQMGSFLKEQRRNRKISRQNYEKLTKKAYDLYKRATIKKLGKKEIKNMLDRARKIEEQTGMRPLIAMPPMPVAN